jgi:dienelactone hydrolase
MNGQMLLRLACVVSLSLSGAAELNAQPGEGAAAREDRLTRRWAGTAPLNWEGDIADRMIAGVDQFLLRQIESSVQRREAFWKTAAPDGAATQEFLAQQRERLAHILGVRDSRQPFDALELLSTTKQPALVATCEGFRVFRVRWPVVRSVHGEGLLLVPSRPEPVADIVAIPDADQTPEMICGLVDGVAEESQFARRLAASGCRVLVPTLIERQVMSRNGRVDLSSREYIYRSAFELGRHIIGYEVQKVLAAIDWFQREAGTLEPRIGVVGWGEGAMLALYSAALDERIDVTCVSGYFEAREGLWQQPIDRNVFGLLERFGDAELASMVSPRVLIIEAARGPQVEFVSGKGGAPGRLRTPDMTSVQREFARARKCLPPNATDDSLQLVVSAEGKGPYLTAETLRRAVHSFENDSEIAMELPPIEVAELLADPAPRAARQLKEMDDFNQWLLIESESVRKQFMQRLDTSSHSAFCQSASSYRDYFRDEVIGRFDRQLLPPNARSRLSYDRPAWRGYEVVLDVFPDVFAYGILIVPKGIQSGERRPVVVCQHGLEGRPQDLVAGQGRKLRAYHDFAGKLAELGFITFSPQNIYIFGDRFRTLQRKANPLKKTLFSIMTPQHQQIVDWLQTLPQVDAERIGFYGLSYGGKSAMRIPALVEDYCLSICSGDFNEWVWKNASTRVKQYSYVWTGEYEIFEFDLGSTFNYAEMATLIAPRPFMVERGHFDGVAPDAAVAYEFAKVRHLYAAQLHLPERCEIEWFVGPHMIYGKGTYDFLRRFLVDF